MLTTSIKSLLRAGGLYVARQTPTEDIARLISLLRPQDAGKELIRIGGPHDGGYLIPDDLTGIQYCFSPGVSDVADFETHLAELGIKSFLADYSVTEPPVQREEFVFDKKFLGAVNNENFFTLESWKEKYLKEYRDDLLLQMDIEGSEYEVILSTSDTLLKQFRILIIEFHGLQRLLDPGMYRIYRTAFEKLLQQFAVVHLHPNNYNSETITVGSLEIPVTIEITFLNKNRIDSPPQNRVDFPHSLDADNDPNSRPLPLPKAWYASAP